MIIPPIDFQNFAKQTRVLRRIYIYESNGIVRRIDDLGRVVIPKEIRRTMRIREGDPALTTLTPESRFIFAMLDLSKRIGLQC